MTRLLLTRHGQSTWNEQGRWQGRADPPLTDLGRSQARHAARSVGMVDAIVASTLQRADETAQIIAEELGVGPVSNDPDLVERYAGEWQGFTREEIEADYPGWLAEGRRPPGWEADELLVERGLRAIARILTTHPTGDVLVVTHGGLIYAIEAHLGLAHERIANLGGRWLDSDGHGLSLGDRVDLLTTDRTVPETP